MFRKKRIRVGVEGKSLGNIYDGIKNVTCHLLNEMAKNEDYEFVVFSPYDYLPQEVTAKVTFIHGGPFAEVPGVWFYLGLPFLLKNTPVDLFWEPRQVLPYAMPSKTKTILTVHDFAFIRFPETVSFLGRKNLEYNCRRSLRRADQIVCVSNFTADEIRNLALFDVDKPIRTIHNGVDETEFFPDPEMPSYGAGFDFSKPYILTVGSLEPKKNLALVVSTYEKWGLTLPNWVVVHSNIWKSGETIEHMQQGPAAKKIHFLRDVSVAELRRLYSHAEALVMASLYEGFGLPLIEAMACGCPVLASDIAVFREIASDAALFFANDPDELALMIESVSDKRRRKIMVLRGLEIARNYSWKKGAREMMEVFENLASSLTRE